MTTHDAARERVRVPVTVRPGLAVSVAFVTVLLAAMTLPAAVPDRPALAYISGGVIGAGLIVGVLLTADLIRAYVAGRSGVTVKRIMIGAFGSRLILARPPSSAGSGRSDAAGGGGGGGGARAAYTGRLAAEARISRAGLAVTAVAGAALTAIGVLAPSGNFALIGRVSLWVGTFALLVTVVEALPAPQTSGGRIVAAAVARRTGSDERGEAAVTKAGAAAGWVVITLGVAAVFLVGFIGVWAVLFGWLMVGSSRLAMVRRRTAAALAGLSVRDVMGAPPPTLSAWQTVSAALSEVALPSHPSLFVVEDFDGSVGGVARLRDLARVPTGERDSVRVRRVAVPLEQVATARPADLLTEAVGRLGVRPAAGVVLVIADVDADARTGAGGARNRVVGVVGPDEINHAVESAPLRGAGLGGVSPWSTPTR